MNEEIGYFVEDSSEKSILEKTAEVRLFEKSEELFSERQGDELTVHEQQLCEYISELLWRDWDPIGVNNMLECRGEYYAYEDGIYLFSKYDPSQLSDYLYHIQSTSLGIEGHDNKESRENVANKIRLRAVELSVGMLDSSH